jgi:hypothetical protein
MSKPAAVLQVLSTHSPGFRSEKSLALSYELKLRQTDGIPLEGSGGGGSGGGGGCDTGSKAAPTDLSELMVSWQAPLPEHAPLQPRKLEPSEAEALRATVAPSV